MQYKLEVPIGKKIYFGDNANLVVEDIEFNGDYSRKDLARNTWLMTRQGLKCITCQQSSENDITDDEVADNDDEE